MSAFLARCGALVRFILSGFDRLRLRGEPQQFNNARGVDSTSSANTSVTSTSPSMPSN